MKMSEYTRVKDMKYADYCAYLINKYGAVPYTYGDPRNRKPALFIHHIKEDEEPGLSSPDQRIEWTEYQVPEFLVYCDYLEHLLLHIMIGRETNPAEALGLNGPWKYIIPDILNYYNLGIKNPNYHSLHYDVIKDTKNVFDLLLNEYNLLVKDIDCLLDHNHILYANMEKCLDTKGRALVVLGTGLGKTTTALQYIKSHMIKALCVVPTNIIKNGWERYKEWVDTITYGALVNKIDDRDYNQYGLIILDEAHHAGYDEESEKGAKKWGEAISRLARKRIKILGLTATPDRTDDIDLRETLFKDCVCEGYSIEDGIEKGIIHPFSYITSIYDSTGLEEEVEALPHDDNDPAFKKLKGQFDIALNNTPTVNNILLNNMPAGDRKGIVFVQNIEKTSEVYEIIHNVFPNEEIRVIDSKMADTEKKANKEWFENTKHGYLIAVNMISEGAHYPGVNTLMFFRTTESYLVYTQQLGRSITLTKDPDPHTIVFDFVNNINKVKYNDRVIDEEKHTISKILSVLQKTPAAISGQIIIKDETQDIVERLKELKNYCGDAWEDWEIEIIKTYYQTEGTAGCQRRIDEEWERRHPGSLTA